MQLLLTSCTLSMCLQTVGFSNDKFVLPVFTNDSSASFEGIFKNCSVSKLSSRFLVLSQTWRIWRWLHASKWSPFDTLRRRHYLSRFPASGFRKKLWLPGIGLSPCVWVNQLKLLARELHCEDRLPDSSNMMGSARNTDFSNLEHMAGHFCPIFLPKTLLRSSLPRFRWPYCSTVNPPSKSSSRLYWISGSEPSWD